MRNAVYPASPAEMEEPLTHRRWPDVSHGLDTKSLSHKEHYDWLKSSASLSTLKKHSFFFPNTLLACDGLLVIWSLCDIKVQRERYESIRIRLLFYRSRGALIGNGPWTRIRTRDTRSATHLGHTSARCPNGCWRWHFSSIDFHKHK